MPGKREDIISWDEFFMTVAETAARRSKDPNTQVGACIVDKENRILSIGYNGTPNAMNDEDFNWLTSDEPYEDKHNYVIHAEQNAILNYRGKLKDLEGTTIYVTLFPCHECSKNIAQVGIKEVVYKDDKYHNGVDAKIARKILKDCGIKTRQY